MRLFNGEPGCDYVVRTNLPHDGAKFTVPALDMVVLRYVAVEEDEFTLKYSFEGLGEDCPKFATGSTVFQEAKAYSLFLQSQQSSVALAWYEDEVEKPSRGSPLVRTLANVPEERQVVWRTSKSKTVASNRPATDRDLVELTATDYEVLIDNVQVHQDRLHNGGVYALLIGIESASNETTIARMVEVTEPNSMNILWLIPQYVVMTLGEVMFSVTGLEFSYSQSPVNMKSVLQACWLLTVAFGNVIVVVVAELKFFESQASEFFLFAGLMFIDMLLFTWMAYRYKPNNPIGEEETTPATATPAKQVDDGLAASPSAAFAPKYVRKLEDD